jgi:uncharacterized membrane protein
MILAWAAGAAVMVLVYLLGGTVLKGFPAAVAEVPFNVVQAVMGAVIGIPLVMAVRKAYPAVDQIGRPREWTEE